MRLHLLKNNGWILLGILLLLSGCHQSPKQYTNKFWAHKANDIEVAKQKRQLFKGLEVDSVYSAYQNELFVGHEFRDTLKGLTFSQWMAALGRPRSTRFWLDVKNLDTTNAEQISQLIRKVTDKYHIRRHVLVENQSHQALKIVKEHKLPVLLWVDNLYWIFPHDTVAWLKTTQEHVNELCPNGLSCEYRLYPLLNSSFPENDIYYWHTPCDKTPENVEFDKMLAKEQNIKVILVDYDEPVEFTEDD